MWTRPGAHEPDPQLWANSTTALWSSWESQRPRELTPTENLEWSPIGGWMAYMSPSGNSCSQADAKRHVPHSFGSHQQGREGGPDDWATQDLLSPRPGFAPWRGHSSHTSVWAQHGSWQFTGYKSLLIGVRKGRHGSASTVGGTIAVPPVDYRPLQAGQPPASKVSARQRLPAPVGAWGLVHCYRYDKRT